MRKKTLLTWLTLLTALLVTAFLQTTSVQAEETAGSFRTWTKELETNQPWEAAYWAEFLADFKANATVQRDAEKLCSQLESNPLHCANCSGNGQSSQSLRSRKQKS